MSDEKETKASAKKAAAQKEAVTTEPVATPTEPEVKEDAGVKSEDRNVVEVSKDDLSKFMKRLEDLESDNKRLLEASDKARMAAISERERGTESELPRVKITRMSPTGPLVVAWQMPEGSNVSYVNGRTLVEHQEMEVFYQDGTSETMPLLTFYRRQNKETKAKVIARTRMQNGSETLKVELIGSGEELDIDLKFVN